MSLTSPHAALTASPDSASPGRTDFVRRWATSPWLAVCVGLLVVSFFILRWSRTSPGYDPYGWLDWGYQAIRGTINIKGAPSWKPITFLFTLPYSIFGHLSWWMWRVTSLAFALGGPVAGGLIGYRLVKRDGRPVWPAWIAAAFAGVGIVMIVQYWHYILSSQSDPMLVTFVLIAYNQLLSKRYGWSITFLVACGLGRPEVWVPLGLLWLWTFWKVPRLRGLLVFYVALMAFLWFGLPVVFGAPWNIAQKLAQHSVRELHHNQFLGTLGRFIHLSEWPALTAAAGTLVWAVLRRDLAVVGVGVLAILWMVVEEWFVLSNGFPGVPRYMFEAAAATIVLGAVGVGWLAEVAAGGPPIPAGAAWSLRSRILQEPAADPASVAAPTGGDPTPPSRGPAGRRPHLALRGLSAVVAVALIAFMVPDARAGWDWEHKDILNERNRTHSIYTLSRAIDAAGGARFIRSCGVPTVDVGTASILAWYTHLNTAQVGYIPAKQIRLGGPVVLFTGLFNGWVLHTYNLHGAAAARCARLQNAYFLETRGHPSGEFFHLSH
ncbi:MAG TPA: hypothetical protein VFN48_02725 [Solirubrobacteraceae bacterium]|nr:hypothetical protein [Solirubrobacteraceae bacterium]